MKRFLFALVISAAAIMGAWGSAAGASTTSPQLAPIKGNYNPTINPANFTNRVDNPYFPLRPGTTLRYRGVAENGRTPQVDEVFVTHRTKQILGVKCVVVRDTVSSRGRPLERTFDWYAQDKQGNVWYMGEDARDYRHGRFVKAPDSWEAGVNGAKPGIIMEAAPRPGDAYRQESYPGHAEDQARVLRGTGRVKVPYRTFGRTLQTIERTPIDPSVEKKWYAAGIGEIKERVVKGNHEAFWLVSVRH
jgi:hypothetical protein